MEMDEKEKEEIKPIQGKPFGIVIICMITALVGFWCFFEGFGFFYKIVALGAFVATYGFWTYQVWGYKLIKIVYIALVVFLTISGYISGHLYSEISPFGAQPRSIEKAIFGFIWGTLIAGPMLYYTSMPKIKALFGIK